MISKFFNRPKTASDQPFFMPIEDSFRLKERGVVVVGHIQQGQIRQGDQVDVVGIHDTSTTVVVHGLEAHLVPIKTAKAGEPVAIMLRKIEAGWIERGMVLAQPDSVVATTTFTAIFELYEPEEMGFPKGNTFPVSSIEFTIIYPVQFSSDPTLSIYKRQFGCTLGMKDGSPISWNEKRPGDKFALFIRVEKPVVVKKKWNFMLGRQTAPNSDDFRPLGIGQVSEISA